MTVLVRPDAELAVKSWLRKLGDRGDIPAIGRNVLLAAPTGNRYPWLTVALVGGTDDDYVDVLGEDEIQIDVLDNDRARAYLIARSVVAQIKALVDGTPMGSDAIAKGGRVVLGPLPRHEPERLTTEDGSPPSATNKPKRMVFRYVVGARFSLIPSA